MKSRFKVELGDLADPQRYQDPLDIAGERPERLLELLETMLLIRFAEETIAEMAGSGAARTPCHLGIGQEAIAAGVCAELTAADRVFGNHRSHSHFLAMGCSAELLLAEVLGKATGCSKGMGGSMHMTAVSQGFWGSVPIVAATIPIAVGAALAAQKDGSDAVAVCFFGDGAVEEGGVHESFNLASVLGLPILFVCENNLYASHMDIAQRQPSDRTARFAEANAINAEVVDGNDVVAVGGAARRLLARARGGDGPGYLEGITYRWRGHVGPRDDLDVGVRRDAETLAAWKRRDPVRRLVAALLDQGQLTQAAADDLEKSVRQRVKDACDKAHAAPYPPAEATLDLVYADRRT